MKTKILVIGPSSTHVDRFIGLVIGSFDDVVFVGEEELVTNHSIRQHCINFRSLNPFSIWSRSRRLRRIIAGENPDVIHIQQVNRVAFLAARILRSMKRKFVVTAWGSDVLVIPQRNVAFKWMTKSVLKKAAFVTADSKDMIEAIQKLTPGAPTGLVLFGITPLGSGTKEKLIYSNRALFPLYNIRLIVDAFAAFHKNHPDWKLAIAGTGPDEQMLKEQVVQAGLTNAVEFCGWLNREKNEAFYRKATIYVSVPVSDGTSVSLLEAMSAGCIPVLSDLPVSHEWITHQQNGIIQTKTDNPLEQAAQLDQQTVAKRNSEIIAARATTEIAAAHFLEIYRQLRD